MPPDPAMGGWHKFAKYNIIIPAAEKKQQATKKPQRTKHSEHGPARKGGRGWQHF